MKLVPATKNKTWSILLMVTIFILGIGVGIVARPRSPAHPTTSFARVVQQSILQSHRRDVVGPSSSSSSVPPSPNQWSDVEFHLMTFDRTKPLSLSSLPAALAVFMRDLKMRCSGPHKDNLAPHGYYMFGARYASLIWLIDYVGNIVGAYYPPSVHVQGQDLGDRTCSTLAVRPINATHAAGTYRCKKTYWQLDINMVNGDWSTHSVLKARSTGVRYHHDNRNVDGKFLTLGEDLPKANKGKPILWEYIKMVSPTENWEVVVNHVPKIAQLLDKLKKEPTYLCNPTLPERKKTGCEEEFHTNSVYWDVSSSTVFLNMKRVATFFAIKLLHANQSVEVLWGCGPMGTLQDENVPPYFLAEGSGPPGAGQGIWGGSHEVTPINSTHFVMYDNGCGMGVRTNSSWILIVKVDLERNKCIFVDRFLMVPTFTTAMGSVMGIPSGDGSKEVSFVGHAPYHWHLREYTNKGVYSWQCEATPRRQYMSYRGTKIHTRPVIGSCRFSSNSSSSVVGAISVCCVSWDQIQLPYFTRGKMELWTGPVLSRWNQVEYTEFPALAGGNIMINTPHLVDGVGGFSVVDKTEIIWKQHWQSTTTCLQLPSHVASAGPGGSSVSVWVRIENSDGRSTVVMAQGRAMNPGGSPPSWWSVVTEKDNIWEEAEEDWWDRAKKQAEEEAEPYEEEDYELAQQQDKEAKEIKKAKKAAAKAERKEAKQQNTNTATSGKGGGKGGGGGGGGKREGGGGGKGGGGFRERREAAAASTATTGGKKGGGGKREGGGGKGTFRERREAAAAATTTAAAGGKKGGKGKFKGKAA